MTQIDQSVSSLSNRILYDDLRLFHELILDKAGLDAFSKEAVTLGLCEASLRGVDSHGVRLLPHYVRSALSGRKNPTPLFNFKLTFPSVGHLDADNAFGHSAGMKAIDHAMELAETQGIGVVAVSNSSHAGAMASMALRAARKGFIAFAFTQGDSLLLSYNGKRSFFGTNPICFAVPRQDADPYCLDMATSIIPWNRLLIHKQNDELLPEGVAADENGNMTRNPHEAKSLLPTGTYKGYGLSSMVEVLCGIYTGMFFGRSIPAMYHHPMEQPRHIGQFYMVMRTDGVVSASHFLEQMQAMTDEVHNEPHHDHTPIMLPGDKEIKAAATRMIEGIPLDNAIVRDLESLGAEFDIPLKLIRP